MVEAHFFSLCPLGTPNFWSSAQSPDGLMGMLGTLSGSRENLPSNFGRCCYFDWSNPRFLLRKSSIFLRSLHRTCLPGSTPHGTLVCLNLLIAVKAVVCFKPIHPPCLLSAALFVAKCSFVLLKFPNLRWSHPSFFVGQLPYCLSYVIR